MLKAVLFDLDNTLIDRDRAFRDCVNTQFSEPAVRAELLLLDHGGRGDRDALFSAWRRPYGAPINRAILGRWLAEHLEPDLRLLDALRALSKTVELGIITNGSGENQRRKFSAAGLSEVVPPTRVWVSGEIGIAKPDPDIFLLASRTLGIAPEHCLYVGDHERDDLTGATAAGMKARLVDAALSAESLHRIIARAREGWS